MLLDEMRRTGVTEDELPLPTCACSTPPKNTRITHVGSGEPSAQNHWEDSPIPRVQGSTNMGSETIVLVEKVPVGVAAGDR